MLEIDVFCDEQWNVDNGRYIGLAMVFVPVQKETKLIKKLLDLRCLNENNKQRRWYLNFDDCPYKDICKPEWHRLDNAEIHFAELRKGRRSKPKTIISKRWLDFVVNEGYNYFSFNTLYIDTKKLYQEKFGPSFEQSVYNRFFRTALKWVKYKYSKSGIKIRKVFHDDSSMKDYRYFSTNLERLTGEDSSIPIEDKKVHFISSDHRKSGDNLSHILQLVDLILGATSHICFYASRDTVKTDIASVLYPLIRKIKQGKNKNHQIQIFPKSKLSKGTEFKDHLENLFDKDIPLRMPAPRQPHPLNEWM